MLKVDVRWVFKSGTSVLRQISVENIGGGYVANYRVQVTGSGSATAPLELHGYPRWSEPLAGFVARVLYAARQALADVTSNELITEYRCSTFLVPFGVRAPRVLFELAAERLGQRYVVRLTQDEHVTVWRAFRTVVRAPVPLLIRTLCRVTWGANRIPSVPAPLALEIHERDGVSYVRKADIPSWVLPAFEKASRGRARPVVDGEHDAWIRAREWQAFLG